MEIVPSIDLENGKCVRLYKGLENTEKIYYNDPIKLFKIWVKFKVKRLHIVDLDRAWGKGDNLKIIEAILKKAENKVKIQVGGGIRKVDDLSNLFRMGADRVILGTLAIKQPEIIKKFSYEFGNERIMVAIDYTSKSVATNGWKAKRDLDPLTLASNMIDYGVGYILFSSIELDGTLEGPDLVNIEKLIKVVDPKRIYIAGGIGSEEDINKLNKLSLKGIIIGKAFYENRIPFSIV